MCEKTLPGISQTSYRWAKGVKIVQYTGEKDKKGQRIFVGDTLKVKSIAGYKRNEPVVGVVVFVRGTYKVHEDLGNGMTGLAHLDEWNKERLGSIHDKKQPARLKQERK